jgi:hypothetical protein
MERLRVNTQGLHERDEESLVARCNNPAVELRVFVNGQGMVCEQRPVLWGPQQGWLGPVVVR